MYLTGKYLIYKEHMNLRKKPTASSMIIGVAERGTCIDVTEVHDNWGKIELNGISGWCCISECFAKKVCDCEDEYCSYSEKYIELLNKYNDLSERIEKIKALF